MDRCKKIINQISLPLNKSLSIFIYYDLRYKLNKFILGLSGLGILVIDDWLLIACPLGLIIVTLIITGRLMKNLVILSAYFSVALQLALFVLVRLIIDYFMS